MSLSPGQSLAHYSILAPLGAGAMGEVWRARDTRLDREVAIKVLPEEFADDHEHLGRFEREAKALAALNHPNVAQIHGVDRIGAACFLVLELVPGETLEERLKHGRLALDEALDVGRQIAEALEAAHEAGVIHRDLKPANVCLTPDGRIKVLDFGLAKPARAGRDPRGSDSVLSTERGRLLGTPTYMAPEQARGRAIDRRVDVWAFGCVLYECLVGQRAFGGDSLSDVLGAVLRDDPQLEALPADTPKRVRELIARCLHKDPFQRLRDMGEARILLADKRADEPPPSPAARAPWLSVVLACALLALGILWWQARKAAGLSNERPAALAIRLDSGPALYGQGNLEQGGVLALAPDGSRLVFVGQDGNQRRLYLRSLDSPAVAPIEGSDGAINPFFSPDGRWIAFFAHGELLKAPVGGGQPTKLCEVGLIRGGAWGPDGTIVFAPTATAPLMRIAAGGGTPTELTKLDPERAERSHRWPVFLPGGQEVAFTIGTVDKPGDYEDASIDAVRLDTGERRRLVRGASFARVLPPNDLVLGRGGQLFVLPLARANGGPLDAAAAIEGISGVAASGVVHCDLSADGTLAYAERDPLATQYELVWLSPDGSLMPLALPPREYQTPRISPDGKRIAVGIGPGGGRASDVWVHDTELGSTTRLTFDENSGTPSWTDEGRRVLYGSESVGRISFKWKLADGTSEGESLVEFTDSIPRFPAGLIPSGDLLPFVTQGTAGTAQDILYWARSDGAEHPLAQTSAGENYPALSPDGAWIAYVTDETGVREVYVQAFPERRGRWQVSEGGGSCPTWSRDGKELFYVDGKRLRATPVTTQPSFRSGPGRTVAELDFLPSSESLVNYDVAPDGRILLVRGTSKATYDRHVNVVLGWGAEVRREGNR